MQYFKPFFRDLQKACQLFSLPISVSRNVVSHAEFASAILLVVEVVFLYDSYSAFAQASLAPVLVPPADIVVWLHCISARLVYLFQTFPS